MKNNFVIPQLPYGLEIQQPKAQKAIDYTPLPVDFNKIKTALKIKELLLQGKTVDEIYKLLPGLTLNFTKKDRNGGGNEKRK